MNRPARDGIATTHTMGYAEVTDMGCGLQNVPYAPGPWNDRGRNRSGRGPAQRQRDSYQQRGTRRTHWYVTSDPGTAASRPCPVNICWKVHVVRMAAIGWAGSPA